VLLLLLFVVALLCIREKREIEEEEEENYIGNIMVEAVEPLRFNVAVSFFALRSACSTRIRPEL